MNSPGHRTTSMAEPIAGSCRAWRQTPLTDFARNLLHWFHETHPGAAHVTQHDAQNQIRKTWHRRHDLIRDDRGAADLACFAFGENRATTFQIADILIVGVIMDHGTR
jgi:hypothetical protein